MSGASKNRIEFYIQAARLPEVLLICGAPFLGVLLTIPDLTLSSIGRAAYVLTGILALAIHIYLYNAWAGLVYDQADPRRKVDPLLRGQLKPAKALAASLVSLSISLAIFLSLSVGLFLIALAKAALWFLYAHPRIALKRIPVVPTLLHVAGGTLAVYLACTAMEGLSLERIWVSFYFGLVLGAGHLNHELLDCEVDRLGNFKTSPIRFGKKPVFIASFIFFTFSTAYFCGLTAAGVLSGSLVLGLVAVYPLYAMFVFRAYKAGISADAIQRLRSQYRALYVAAGVYMTLILLLAKID